MAKPEDYGLTLEQIEGVTFHEVRTLTIAIGNILLREGPTTVKELARRFAAMGCPKAAFVTGLETMNHAGFLKLDPSPEDAGGTFTATEKFRLEFPERFMESDVAEMLTQAGLLKGFAAQGMEMVN